MSVHTALDLLPVVGSTILASVPVRLRCTATTQFAECLTHGLVLDTLSLAGLLTTI